MKIDKGFLIFWSIVLSLIIVVIILGYGIHKEVTESKKEHKRLCEERGFTWIERNDGIIVDDCYELKDGIIQFYNTYQLNGTRYLMRGTR